jgi:4'-phosphopantetheinyl transferase
MLVPELRPPAHVAPRGLTGAALAATGVDGAPSLAAGEVLVWRVALDVDAAAVATLESGLDDDERVRAARFVVPAARRRFVVARVALRQLLGHYTGTDPGALRLEAGARGKPALAVAHVLRFNVAHSGDWALIALARGREVGVDIEATPRDIDPLGVAAQVFSDAERHALQAVALGERHDAFARIWTRKEAYIKARGEGFSYPTRSFTVSHGPGDADALLADAADDGATGRWRVQDLAAPGGYFAALAAAGRDWTVRRVGRGVGDGAAEW